MDGVVGKLMPTIWGSAGGRASLEAFGVSGVGRLQDTMALFVERAGATEMHAAGVMKPIPEWRCSSLYQPKKFRR